MKHKASLEFADDGLGGVTIRMVIVPPLAAGEDSPAVALALAASRWLSGEMAQAEAETLMSGDVDGEGAES